MGINDALLFFKHQKRRNHRNQLYRLYSCKKFVAHKRAHSHKVFEGLVNWGKTSTGWKFGFKLHLIINDKGELLAFKLTPANIDDRKPIPEMSEGLWGKLFEKLYEKGLELISKSKKNMKNRLVKLMDKILLRKRALYRISQ